MKKPSPHHHDKDTWVYVFVSRRGAAVVYIKAYWVDNDHAGPALFMSVHP